MTNEDAIRILKEIHSGTNTTLMQELNSLWREKILLDDCKALTMAIEALEKCKQIDEALGQGEKVYIMPKDGLWLYKGVDVMYAIEKQIPKRAIYISDAIRCCPSCVDVGFDPDESLIDYGSYYCKRCGQAILWEAET